MNLPPDLLSKPATRRRIRVVHLVTTLDYGGLEMMVYHLVRLRDRARFDMRVLCLGPRGDLADRVEAEGVPVESLVSGGAYRGATLRRLLARLREIRPHVLHSHNPGPHLQATLARMACRVPVVLNTKHGRNSTDRRRTWWRNRFCAWFSDSIVPVSEDAAHVARTFDGVLTRKIRVILNGVDLADYEAPQRHVDQFKCRAVSVARLNPIKDQATLLRAVRSVVDVHPQFRLELVGDGPLRQQLEALCRELQLTEHVHFSGFRDDVRQRLAASDLFVLSSLSEGIALTLCEAMASALPVVATAVGGNPEVVMPGKTGWLVPPRDPDALAGALLEALSDRERLVTMGQAGRQRVEERFDIRQTVREYESHYQALLESRRTRPHKCDRDTVQAALEATSAASAVVTKADTC